MHFFFQKVEEEILPTHEVSFSYPVPKAKTIQAENKNKRTLQTNIHEQCLAILNK